MNERAIADAIKHTTAETRPVMIAIEGFGGSGKSTLAENLKNLLGNTYVVNIDDFIIKDKVSDATKSNFDRQRLEQQVLSPIKHGLRATYQQLNWNSNTLSEPITIPDVDYLIVEGVSSTDPSIEHYYDFTIWVETPAAIAEQRGRARDRSNGEDNDALWQSWTNTYAEYKALHHPELRADFIFTNTADSTP